MSRIKQEVWLLEVHIRTVKSCCKKCLVALTEVLDPRQGAIFSGWFVNSGDPNHPDPKPKRDPSSPKGYQEPTCLLESPDNELP